MRISSCRPRVHLAFGVRLTGCLAMGMPSAPIGHGDYDRDFVRGTGDRPGRIGRDGAPQPPAIDYASLPTVGPFNCFVGNLPFEVTESDIRGVFASVPLLGVKIPRDPEQRGRGFAYLELPNQDSLVKALLLSGSVWV